jgi:hypothetical protein
MTKTSLLPCRADTSVGLKLLVCFRVQGRGIAFMTGSNEAALCDCCNNETSFTAGTYYTASEFVTLLREGLEPGQGMITLAMVSGIPKGTLMAALPNEISSNFSTGWLLCPSCAARACKILAKTAGNLPGGELGSTTQQTALGSVSRAGLGKMAAIVGAMGVKVMTGCSLSTSTQGKCDFCSAVMLREKMTFIPAGEMQHAVRSGFHPFGKAGIAIARSVPDEVVQKWRQKALSDNTNWGLCPNCSTAFARHTGGASLKESKPTKKPWQFWK